MAQHVDTQRAVVSTRLASAVLLLLGSARSVQADVAVSRLLSDPTALAHRLRDIDPLVASARENINAASAAARQARVYPNPQLSGQAGNITIGRGNRYGGDIGPTSFSATGNLSVGIAETIEIGKREPRAAAADARVRAAHAQAVAALGTRVSNAMAVLGRVAYVAARRDVVATNLQSARKLQELESVRLKHQDLAPVDYERIELETRTLELQLHRADADLATSLADCAALMQDTCAAAAIDANVLDQGAPLPEALPEVTRAIIARPHRDANRLEIAGLEADAQLAEHRRIPDPVLGLSYTYDRYEYSGSVPQSLMFSIGIPLPFFDTGEHDASATRATARALQAEEQAEVRSASGAVRGLLARRDALLAMLAELEQQSLPSSTRIIEQTRKAFDLGQSRLGDLLLVERAHRDLLLDVLDTRFELFEVRAELRQELGLDDEVARSVEKQ